MKKFALHFRNYVIRGILAIIPIALSVIAIRFLYVAIDRQIMGLIDHVVGFKIPGLGILILLLALYVIGVVASNVLGKQIFGIIEKVSSKLPIIKTTYLIGKQLVSTLSLPEKQIFKRVVLVDYLKPGIWTIGFVTGSIIDCERNDEALLKVFVPTPPNPTSGTMVVVKESETRDPGWSIEQAMKCVISGGIIGPNEIGKPPIKEHKT
jgi:uncharacterized membrane protein